MKWAKPGYEAGVKQIEDFCDKRLRKFADKRNDPMADAISNLAPWFNFGMYICLLNQDFKSNCVTKASVVEDSRMEKQESNLIFGVVAAMLSKIKIRVHPQSTIFLGIQPL